MKCLQAGTIPMSILDKKLLVSRLAVDQHLRMLTYEIPLESPPVATTGYYQSRRLR